MKKVMVFLGLVTMFFSHQLNAQTTDVIMPIPNAKSALDSLRYIDSVRKVLGHNYGYPYYSYKEMELYFRAARERNLRNKKLYPNQENKIEPLENHHQNQIRKTPKDTGVSNGLEEEQSITTGDKMLNNDRAIGLV